MLPKIAHACSFMDPEKGLDLCENLALCEYNIALVLVVAWCAVSLVFCIGFAWTLSTLSDFCDWKLSGKANMQEG